MASRYETSSAGYTVRRTRSGRSLSSEDYGAVDGLSRLPNPIAVMEGPASITGPAAAVGANEVWSLDIPIPATPDVAWVATSGDYLFAGDASKPDKMQLTLLGAGDGGSTVTFQHPVLGGVTTTTFYTASDGTFDRAVFADTAIGQRLWIPIDPDATQGGTFSNFVCYADAAGFAINTCFLNLSGVRFIGFPINYWENGALFMGAY